MTRIYFLTSLCLILLRIYSSYNNFIILMLFLILYLCLFKIDKKFFILLNLITIFEILLKFPDVIKMYDWKVKYKFLSNIKDESVKSYISLFLFNDKNNELYDISVNLSISYLIVISGLHINMIRDVLNKILSFFIDIKISKIVSVCTVAMYVVIIGLPISALRALLMLVLSFNKKLNTYDKLFLTIIIVFLLSPNSIFELSYIYSFLLSFVIISVSSNLPKNRLLSLMCVSILSFFVTLPINVYVSSKINVLSIIYSVIFTYPFLIIIMFSFLMMIIPGLSFLYSKCINTLMILMRFFDRHTIYVYLYKFTIIDYFAYYIIIIVILLLINKKSKNVWKGLYLIIILIFSIYSYQYNDSIYEVVFVDVYQGDCIIFKSKYGREAYMVDTGGNDKINIAKEVLFPTLKILGIDKLRAVVITHDDFDHCGALNQLNEMIEIDKIYYELDYIDVFSYRLKNINDNIYENDNDNSIVLYGNYANIDIFLSGDISAQVEKKIIQKYPDLNIDILKVAHHGSKYSTCNEFLNLYKPKISVLSYGYNHYGHPSKDVINRLIQVSSLIYSTFEDGTLIFSSNNKKEFYLRILK